MDSKEIAKAEKEVQKLTSSLDRARARSQKLELLGGTEKQLENAGYDCEILENKLYEATLRMEQLQAAAQVTGFQKLKTTAKSATDSLKRGIDQSNKKLAQTGRMLKSIILSMVVFQAMSKGLEFIKEGFSHLAEYSVELKTSFADMKAEVETLKNSMATAFAPIVQQIIPYLMSMVQWLTKAMDALAQFWAVLSGKSTYSRAKKQVAEYGKSVEEAGKKAKGALASFDDLNVLEKDDSASEDEKPVGADMFEEVEIDQRTFEWVDWLKANLSDILTIIGAIGMGFLAWKLSSLFTSSLSVLFGMMLVSIGAVVAFRGAMDAIENGISWKNLAMMIGGVAVAIGGLALAFGGIGAVVGAVVGALLLISVGIYDIYKNGVNLKNGIAVVVGAFIGAFALFGGWIAVIAAAVAGLVLAIIADWENFKRTVGEPLKEWGNALLANATQIIGGIKRLFDGMSKFLNGIFQLDMKMAVDGLIDIFMGLFEAIDGVVKLVVNTIIGIINTIVNVIFGAINAIINAINSISVDIPEWVPIFGGSTFSPDIPTLGEPFQIPYLETGGIVTNATKAVIGENGREAVLPLDNHTEWMDELADRVGNRTVVIRFEGSLAELGRVLKPVIDKENDRVGVSLR